MAACVCAVCVSVFSSFARSLVRHRPGIGCVLLFMETCFRLKQTWLWKIDNFPVFHWLKMVQMLFSFFAPLCISRFPSQFSLALDHLFFVLQFFSPSTQAHLYFVSFRSGVEFGSQFLVVRSNFCAPRCLCSRSNASLYWVPSHWISKTLVLHYTYPQTLRSFYSIPFGTYPP